jgi:L-alanine-DL-glutamate epimerase-like enolase superfamily enzyme
MGRDENTANGRLRLSKPTDVRIQELSFSYEDYTYRTPIKFGGTVLDRVTILNVDCAVTTLNGRTAKGFGSMPLSNVWAFPSKSMPYEVTLGAMKTLAGRICKMMSESKATGHPIDIQVLLEPEWLRIAAEVSAELKLDVPIPKLCTLVTASAFDAAVHDAYGKVHGVNCYQTYNPEFMSHDLAHDLGAEFRGESLELYVSPDPKPRMPLYHLVGAVDPIFPSDVMQPVGDGLPENLPEWIRFNGLTHLKIKLNGDSLQWDIDRVLSVDRAATETQHDRGVSTWYYSLDFNEKCPSVEYLLECLRRVKEKSPAGFDRIQYVEQPTARDLGSSRQNTMHAAARLKPIVIDESLTDLESLRLAREMGYTGAALKACKTQSHSLLMAAAGRKYDMFLCVQDLTCPGASLIHSAGLAAHVPTVAAIEANSRQYVPAANKAWEARFPGIFHVTEGAMDTSGLTGPGLGAV